MHRRVIKYPSGYLCCARRTGDAPTGSPFLRFAGHTLTVSHIHRNEITERGIQAYSFTGRIIRRNCKTENYSSRDVPSSDYCPPVRAQLGNNQSPGMYHVSYSLAKWNLIRKRGNKHNRDPPTSDGKGMRARRDASVTRRRH